MSEENNDTTEHVAPLPLPVLPSHDRVEELRNTVSHNSAAPHEGDESKSASASENSATSSTDPVKNFQQKLLHGKVIEVLSKIYDPEIPVNIYEMGLIYDVAVDDENRVKIKMTLTAPACPVAGTLPGEVEQKIEAIPEVKSADVELVWEPPWSKDRMSEAALLQLGL